MSTSAARMMIPPSNLPDRVAQTLQDHVHRSLLFFLAPTDRKAAFREDIADACNLPGLVLHTHRQAIVHIPTASKPIGISSRKRQRQDSQGRGIPALIRNDTASKLPPR